MTLDDVWEAKVACAGGEALEVESWTCWHGPVGCDWQDSSSDEEDGGPSDEEEERNLL